VSPVLVSHERSPAFDEDQQRPGPARRDRSRRRPAHLIRPDMDVGAHCRLEDAAALVDYVEQWLASRIARVRDQCGAMSRSCASHSSSASPAGWRRDSRRARLQHREDHRRIPGRGWFAPGVPWSAASPRGPARSSYRRRQEQERGTGASSADRGRSAATCGVTRETAWPARRSPTPPIADCSPAARTPSRPRTPPPAGT
jgi:hypothetical protein